MGQLGWSLGAYATTNLITYFYLPPGDGQTAIFPTYIYQGLLMGFATIIGLVTLGGRLFDAITDPLIANWSDKANVTTGRRKPFLKYGALPFAIFSVLAFIPLTGGQSVLNAIWLSFCLVGFFFCMTLYVTPYTTWLSELGHNKNERLNLSTYISVAWALGFAIGITIPTVQQYLETFYTATQAFQMAIAFYAVIAFIFMMVPVVFIDEPKYSLQGKSDLTAIQSIKTVLKDANFKAFALTDLFYWMALTSIQLGLVYYVTVLLAEEKDEFTYYAGIMFALSFLFYAPVNSLAKKVGKKPLITAAFIVYAFVFAGILSIGYLPMLPKTQLLILIVLSALPTAVFGILPNVVIADLAEKGESEDNNTGMYFGVRMFMMKLGVSATNFIFPSLLICGKSVGNDLGVRLTAVFALIVCIAALFVFRKFKEV